MERREQEEQEMKCNLNTKKKMKIPPMKMPSKEELIRLEAHIKAMREDRELYRKSVEYREARINETMERILRRQAERTGNEPKEQESTRH